jgi:hypothetical protein
MMVRPLALCFSFFLVILGVIGIFGDTPRWLVAADFVVGAIGIAADAVLWKTRGRGAVLVAGGMAALLAALFIATRVAHAAGWMSGVILAFACFFAVLAFARWKVGPTPEL